MRKIFILETMRKFGGKHYIFLDISSLCDSLHLSLCLVSELREERIYGVFLK